MISCGDEAVIIIEFPDTVMLCTNSAVYKKEQEESEDPFHIKRALRV